MTLLSSSLYIYLDGPPSIDLPCKFFFIHKYFSLSPPKYLFRPTSSHTLTLSRHIDFIPLFLSPSSFLNQLFLLPPFPFFRRYFYQPPLRYIEFSYFFFLLSIPDQTEFNSAPLFSPLFLWVFSLLTVDCCISLVSPPVPGS